MKTNPSYKKFTPIFCGKNTTDCCDPGETLLDTKNCPSDIITGNIKILLGEVQKPNGEYQLFHIYPVGN